MVAERDTEVSSSVSGKRKLFHAKAQRTQKRLNSLRLLREILRATPNTDLAEVEAARLYWRLFKGANFIAETNSRH